MSDSAANSAALESPRRLWARFVAGLGTRSRFEVAAGLTILLTLFFPFEAWYFQITAQLLAIVFVLHRRAAASPLYWYLLALLGSFAIFEHWQPVDNHKYLLVYWLWGLVAAAFFSSEDDRDLILRRNARFMICFIMLGAVVQKTISGSYLDSTMFEVILLTDLRFEGLLAVMGVDQHDLALSQAVYNDLRAPVPAIAGGEAVLLADERLKAIAVTFTWLDYAIQVVVGVLFLLPGERMERFAHLSLVVFILFIYFVAPVLGFGWLIAVLGMTLAHARFPRFALGYLASFIVLISYQIPWSKVAMELGWLEVMQ
jgi:hypothetical protein